MFKEYVIVVTGAASGIGLATSRLFHEAGATVIGVDVDKKSLDAVTGDLGERFVPCQCDVTQEDQIVRLADFVESKYGKIDTLVNNAGTGNLINLETMQESDFYWIYDVNLKGPMLFTKHFIALLKKSSNPSILNVSSSAAREVLTGNHFLYSTSKAALLSFTQHLVRNFPGIRANSILPGWVDTPIYSRAGLDDETIRAIYECALQKIPSGRIGKPEDIAHCILFLSSEKATYINGAAVDINGGTLCDADWGFLF